MINKIIFFLSFVVVIVSIVWVIEQPREIEPKITLLGGLIGLLTIYVKYKNSVSTKTEPENELSLKKPINLGNAAVLAENDQQQTSNIEISPSVFISYAHESEDHKRQALELADNLNDLGVDCWIDRYVEDNPPQRGWPMWMEERIRLSSSILLVCSERYLARIEGREETSKGQGVKFESLLLVQALYGNDSINDKIIPIIFKTEDSAFIPSIFKSFTHYCISSEIQFDKLYRRLTNQPEIVKPKVGKVKRFGLKSEKNKPTEPEINIIKNIPQLVEFKNNMKQAHKIMQAYLSLSITRRFEIANKLGLLEPGENYNSSNKDQISAMVLVRAKNRNQLSELWSILFDESIDPNPFKNN